MSGTEFGGTYPPIGPSGPATPHTSDDELPQPRSLPPLPPLPPRMASGPVAPTVPPAQPGAPGAAPRPPAPAIPPPPFGHPSLAGPSPAYPPYPGSGTAPFAGSPPPPVGGPAASGPAASGPAASGPVVGGGATSGPVVGGGATGAGEPGLGALGLLAPPPMIQPATRRSRVAEDLPGPGRRLIFGSLMSAVLGGSLLGLVVGIVAPAEPPTARVIMADAAQATPTVSPVTPAASRSASPSPTVRIRTVTQTEAAPPQDHIAQPWADRTLQFVTLEDIRRDDQNGVTLKVTTTKLLSGDRAKRFLEQNGQPAREFAADPSGGETFEITVREDATVFGEFFLGNHTDVQLQRFSRDDLFNYSRGALDHGRKPTFWLKRSLFVSGPAIYVAEQYVG